jgi:hypothetical protein
MSIPRISSSESERPASVGLWLALRARRLGLGLPEASVASCRAGLGRAS